MLYSILDVDMMTAQI